MTKYNTFSNQINTMHTQKDSIITIELNIDDYIDLLDDRRNFVEEHYGWHIPDRLWSFVCDSIKDCGISCNNRPDYVVDNAIINGDWGTFDNYKQKYETDDEFIHRVEDGAFFIDKDERIVCFSI